MIKMIAAWAPADADVGEAGSGGPDASVLTQGKRGHEHSWSINIGTKNNVIVEKGPWRSSSCAGCAAESKDKMPKVKEP